MKPWLGFFAVWAVFAAVMFGINWGLYHEDDIQIPLKNEIEKAVEVNGLENKFSYMKWGFFSGAGAGGLGAPAVSAKTAEQFIELVPQSENIYVTFAFDKTIEGEDNDRILKKIYWAFIENRAGLMMYEDIYRYKNYWVEDYDNSAVYFHYDNRSHMGPLTNFLILWGVVGFLASIFISVAVYFKITARR